MQKKYIFALMAFVFISYFFSCSSGNRLRFYQPSKQNLVGVRKLVIAPCTESSDAELLCSQLENTLKNTNYFLVFDNSKFSSVLEQYNLTFDSIAQSDTTAKIGKLLNVDAIIFAKLKNLELLPIEKGSDLVEKMVWTGEYERDETGEIVEVVNEQGQREKQKKFKLQPVDQHYQIRKAQIEADFSLIDLKKGEPIFSHAISENYDSGKIVRDEDQTLPKDEVVKRQLALKVNRRFLSEIAPEQIEVKRVVEGGPTLIDSGAVYAKNGEWRDAMKMWEQAKKLYPANASVYYNLGLASEAQGDYESAEIYYRKAALLNSKSKQYQKAIENIRSMWQEQKRQ